MKEEVLERVRSAYKSLVERDFYLLQVDANERSITHKFGEYLQAEFPKWNVDCEFNRDRALPKRLSQYPTAAATDDTEGTTVFPDIIVHCRGTSENLLVIEAKKSSTANHGSDIQKLGAYKSEHGYQFALAVVFPVGPDAPRASAVSDIVGVEL